MGKYSDFPFQSPWVRRKSAIYIPKRDDEHPFIFIMGVPLGSFTIHLKEILKPLSAFCNIRISLHIIMFFHELEPKLYTHLQRLYWICCYRTLIDSSSVFILKWSLLLLLLLLLLLWSTDDYKGSYIKAQQSVICRTNCYIRFYFIFLREALLG